MWLNSCLPIVKVKSWLFLGFLRKKEQNTLNWLDKQWCFEVDQNEEKL